MLDIFGNSVPLDPPDRLRRLDFSLELFELELEIEVPAAQLEHVLGRIESCVEVLHEAVEQTLLLRPEFFVRREYDRTDRHRALEQHRLGVDELVPDFYRPQQIGGKGVESLLAGRRQTLVEGLVAGQWDLAAGYGRKGRVVDVEKPPENRCRKGPRVTDLGAAEGLGVLEEVAVPDRVNGTDRGVEAPMIAGAKTSQGHLPLPPIAVNQSVDAFFGHHSHLLTRLTEIIRASRSALAESG